MYTANPIFPITRILDYPKHLIRLNGKLNTESNLFLEMRHFQSVENEEVCGIGGDLRCAQVGPHVIAS